MTNQRTSTPKSCEQCGITFFPFRASTGQFCSNVCKFRAREQPVTITCAGCGIDFQKRNHKAAKCCTNECYQLAKKSRSALERLEPFIDKTDYCWLWTGGTNKLGYGRIFFQGKFWLAHRLMYVTCVEPVEADVVIRHYVCDNPPCCNPDHLRPGTKADNSLDAVRHKRHAHGETTYAKLSEAVVRTIWHDRRTQEVIAADYNVARRTVGHIKNGTTWKHLGLGRNTFRNPTRVPK